MGDFFAGPRAFGIVVLKRFERDVFGGWICEHFSYLVQLAFRASVSSLQYSDQTQQRVLCGCGQGLPDCHGALGPATDR
jgi:hypothetical protein